MCSKKCVVIHTFMALLTSVLLHTSDSLLYPTASSLGLVSSISVPIYELFPERKLLIDWCFQMSYDLPAQLSSFYNIPIWPGKHNPKNRKRAVDLEQWGIGNNWPPMDRYNVTSLNGRHPSDLSAGEMYQNLENILISYGYHETCLLRSVCELARHPFHEDDRNILTDLITFVLTPSQHEGFAPSELLYRQAYEAAERSGFLGENCAALYHDCPNDLLGTITQLFIPE